MLMLAWAGADSEAVAVMFAPGDVVPPDIPTAVVNPRPIATPPTLGRLREKRIGVEEESKAERPLLGGTGVAWVAIPSVRTATPPTTTTRAIDSGTTHEAPFVRMPSRPYARRLRAHERSFTGISTY